MPEIKKLKISRKKVDPHGNEYALIKISSNRQKHQEIRIIKLKKSNNKSKAKKPVNNENSKINMTNKKYESPINKIANATIYAQSNKKASFTFHSPRQSTKIKNYKYLNRPNLNGCLYSPNIYKNNTILVGNSDFSKYAHSSSKQQSQLNKNEPNMYNQMNLIKKKKEEFSSKLNNLKINEMKFKSIKPKKLNYKKIIPKIQKNILYENEYNKKLLEEIKEINNYKNKGFKYLNINEEKEKKKDIEKDNNKTKTMVKNEKQIINPKNRTNYWKIRTEEKKGENNSLRYNLFRYRKKEKQTNFNKTSIKPEDKAMQNLKKKYELIKKINSEFKSYIKNIKYMTLDCKETANPIILSKLNNKGLSSNLISNISNNNTIRKNSSNRNETIKNNKNNSEYL